MGRHKQTKVSKSSFKLRQRKLADGRVSLFIDHIVDGRHEYEFLKLYLLSETSVKVKRENARIMREAEDMVRQRTEEEITVKAEAELAKDKSTMLLVDFCNEVITDYKSREMNSYKNFSTCSYSLASFRPDARLCDIDRKFINDYSEWLNCEYMSVRKRKLSPKTVFSYHWYLCNLLHQAWRKGYISFNPWSRLETTEKLQEPETQKGFLTIEEVRTLEEAQCPDEWTKCAFLFSCYCGLRISDIEKLRWRDIVKIGDQWTASVIMKKTSKPFSIPLPAKALQWLPQRGESKNDDLVFRQLKSQPQISKHLRTWAKDAGLQKDITYHMSRHTYGTMLITAGVDIYTASKLMGHSDVRATQVYAKIIDKKKEDAMALIDLAF